MKFTEKLLYYLSVPRCVCCGERLGIDERALCRICKAEYAEHKKRNCSRCSRVLSECVCTNDYLKRHCVRRLVKIFRYINRADSERETPSNMLIYSLKRDNRADVLDFLSTELASAVKKNIAPKKTEYIITSVPRRCGAIRKYGIDHAKLIATATARKLDIPYASLLKSTAKAPQKKMREEQRIKNATFDYRKTEVNVKGKRVILVDDIVTTGASMGSCAMLIRALGAREIIGATLSIAYRDKVTT